MSEIMLSGLAPADGDTGPEVTPLGEGRMVREDCWREVHRLFHVERRAESGDAPAVGPGWENGGGGFPRGGGAAPTRARRGGTPPPRHAGHPPKPGPPGPGTGRPLVPG